MSNTIMNSTLKKSRTNAKDLQFSIVQQFPQNTQIQPSEYAFEQKVGIVYSRESSPRRHQRYSSLVESQAPQESYQTKGKEGDQLGKYFNLIQSTLLLENQNLKNQNKFLLEQIQKQFRKQKAMKKAILGFEGRVEVLEKTNKELEHQLKYLAAEAMQEILVLEKLIQRMEKEAKKQGKSQLKNANTLDYSESQSNFLTEIVFRKRKRENNDVQQCQKLRTEESLNIPSNPEVEERCESKFSQYFGTQKGFQTANFSEWVGEPSHGSLRKKMMGLCESIFLKQNGDCEPTKKQKTIQ